jgi:hypothetical protein
VPKISEKLKLKGHLDGTEIKSLYEGVPDTNAFTDSEKYKLNNLVGNIETFILLLTPPEVNITLDANIPAINYFPYAMTVTSILASLDIAPTGSAAVINVFKNGTTMLNASKLTIAAGTKTVVGTLVTTTIAAGDVISASIDQIGATVRGQYLSITINGERA